MIRGLKVWGSIGLISLAICASTAQASLMPLDEALETTLNMVIIDGFVVALAFGPDDGNNITLSTTGVGLTTSNGQLMRTITYHLLPGQTYVGQAISLTGISTFNDTLGQFEWASDGQLGSSSWTVDGSLEWVGDPEPVAKANVIFPDKTNYTLEGTGELVESERHNVSKGTFTLTPAGGET